MSTGMFVVLTGVVFFLITCVALLDIARKDFGSIQMKALWAFVTALVPFIGVTVYFLFGFRKGKRPAIDAPVD
ncbi:PLDc N-terminal domain-containing protein [Desulfosarcina sp.]|uniref:PLDc N-terminal domain-containing protein n=1 Tax=Desulfosarcina sp. TaxID=2027861 RepID=UPI003565DA50